jgi:hypothetical protein
VGNRLAEDSFIYIFYNIIDERLQLQAARSLYMPFHIESTRA